jgi:beta-galactosidase
MFFLFFTQNAQQRNVYLLDTGWKFINSDVPNADSQTFDDAGWQEIRVPHDWAVLGNFNMNLDVQRVQAMEDGDKRLSP